VVERSSRSKSAKRTKKRAGQVSKRVRGTCGCGIVAIRDGVWRVDVEVKRDPLTGQRRPVSRTVYGTREEAEVTLARLRVAGHENRLAIVGTRARSVDAVFEIYQQSSAGGRGRAGAEHSHHRPGRVQADGGHSGRRATLR
jgi:hypothetical protein